MDRRRLRWGSGVSRRNLLAASLGVVGTSLLASCGQEATAPLTKPTVSAGLSAPTATTAAIAPTTVPAAAAEKPPVVAKPVTITVWFPPTGNYTEYLTSQTALFQQSQDKVKVIVEPSGATDKLQASIVAGTPPTCSSRTTSRCSCGMRRGHSNRSTSTWTSEAKATTTTGRARVDHPGQVLRVALDAKSDRCRRQPDPACRTGALAQMPAQGTTANWTFDQWRKLLQASATVTGDVTKDVYGTAFMGTTTWYWEMMYLWGNGAEIYNSDETKVIVNSPEGIAGLEMLLDVQTKDRVAPPAPKAWTPPRPSNCSTPSAPRSLAGRTPTSGRSTAASRAGR